MCRDITTNCGEDTTCLAMWKAQSFDIDHYNGFQTDVCGEYLCIFYFHNFYNITDNRRQAKLKPGHGGNGGICGYPGKVGKDEIISLGAKDEKNIFRRIHTEGKICYDHSYLD